MPVRERPTPEREPRAQRAAPGGRREPRTEVRALQAAAGNRALARVAAGRRQRQALQRLQDLTDREWTSQATNLAAELQGPARTLDLGKFHSGGGLHAEDALIAALPGACAGLPAGHYQLMIMINRSPCSSRPGVAHGCAQKLIRLAQHGVGGPPPTHTFAIVVYARNLYGSSAVERAASYFAVLEMRAAGIHVTLDANYFDPGTARVISQLMG